MQTTPIYGFVRPDSNDYADQLGDDMGATVDRLEAVLAGIGVTPTPDVTSLSAEVTARQALAARVLALEGTAPVAVPLAAGAAAFGIGFAGPRISKLGYQVTVQGLAKLSAALPASSFVVVANLAAAYRPTNGTALVNVNINGIWPAHLEYLTNGEVHLVNDQTAQAMTAGWWFPMDLTWDVRP